MNERRVRDLKFYLEYEYSSTTKDQIEDLLTVYPSVDETLSKAIALLHEKHFGSLTTKNPPATYSKTFSATNDVASKKLDELWEFFQEMKAQSDMHQTANIQKNKQQITQISEEANKKIIEKIEELGMRFMKILPKDDQKTGQKTAEMTKEEVLHLIKRIDQLESKITRAISESKIPSTGPIRRGSREIAEPPKAAQIKAVEGRITEQPERPLLDDVLETVIVSVDKDKGKN